MAKQANNRRCILYLPPAQVRQTINALTLQAEHARSLRELEKVGTIAESLMKITKPFGLEAIAVYYKGISLNRGGGGSSASIQIFETLSEYPLAVVRARAILALGSIAFSLGNYDEATTRYERAAKMFNPLGTLDPVGNFHLAMMQAVLTSVRGDHKTALAQLINMSKITAEIHLPVLQYTLMNSIALELAATSQIASAQSLINQVVRCPIAKYFPEWRQTQMEIARSTGSRQVKPQTERGTVTQMHAYKERRARTRLKLRIFERLIASTGLTVPICAQILDLIPA